MTTILFLDTNGILKDDNDIAYYLTAPLGTPTILALLYVGKLFAKL